MMKKYIIIHPGKAPRIIYTINENRSEILDQFEKIEILHANDLSSGYAGVFLPEKLENKKKYKNYSKALIWQC